MFSRRVAEPERQNALTQAIVAARAEQRPLLDLTESNPTRVGLPYAAEELLSALAASEALVYAPEPFGLPSARQAVAQHYAERGVSVSADRILLTASTSEAYGFLLKLLCDPGDQVLIPAPSYPLLDQLAELEAVELVRYPLVYDGAWHIEGSLSRWVTERTRAVLLVSPNNPTGNFLKSDELSQLAGLGLPLICDEVFAEYALSSDARRASSVLSCQDVLCFAMGGLSKSAALPQLKLGWTACGGPPDLVRAAVSRLELIADAYLSVSAPVQHALPTILSTRAPVVAALRARVVQNLSTLRRVLEPSPAHVLHLEGGWYAVIRLPATLDDEAWCLAFLADGVVAQPGYFFDFVESGAFAVVSLIGPPAPFAAGAERMARCVSARA